MWIKRENAKLYETPFLTDKQVYHATTMNVKQWLIHFWKILSIETWEKLLKRSIHEDNIPSNNRKSKKITELENTTNPYSNVYWLTELLKTNNMINVENRKIDNLLENMDKNKKCSVYSIKLYGKNYLCKYSPYHYDVSTQDIYSISFSLAPMDERVCFAKDIKYKPINFEEHKQYLPKEIQKKVDFTWIKAFTSSRSNKYSTYYYLVFFFEWKGIKWVYIPYENKNWGDTIIFEYNPKDTTLINKPFNALQQEEISSQLLYTEVQYKGHNCILFQNLKYVNQDILQSNKYNNPFPIELIPLKQAFTEKMFVLYDKDSQKIIFDNISLLKNKEFIQLCKNKKFDYLWFHPYNILREWLNSYQHWFSTHSLPEYDAENNIVSFPQYHNSMYQMWNAFWVMWVNLKYVEQRTKDTYYNDSWIFVEHNLTDIIFNIETNKILYQNEWDVYKDLIWDYSINSFAKQKNFRYNNETNFKDDNEAEKLAYATFVIANFQSWYKWKLDYQKIEYVYTYKDLTFIVNDAAKGFLFKWDNLIYTSKGKVSSAINHNNHLSFIEIVDTYITAKKDYYIELLPISVDENWKIYKSKLIKWNNKEFYKLHYLTEQNQTSIFQAINQCMNIDKIKIGNYKDKAGVSIEIIKWLTFLFYQNANSIVQSFIFSESQHCFVQVESKIKAIKQLSITKFSLYFFNIIANDSSIANYSIRKTVNLIRFNVIHLTNKQANALWTSTKVCVLSWEIEKDNKHRDTKKMWYSCIFDCETWKMISEIGFLKWKYPFLVDFEYFNSDVYIIADEFLENYPDWIPTLRQYASLYEGLQINKDYDLSKIQVDEKNALLVSLFSKYVLHDSFWYNRYWKENAFDEYLNNNLLSSTNGYGIFQLLFNLNVVLFSNHLQNYVSWKIKPLSDNNSKNLKTYFKSVVQNNHFPILTRKNKEYKFFPQYKWEDITKIIEDSTNHSLVSSTFWDIETENEYIQNSIDSTYKYNTVFSVLNMPAWLEEFKKNSVQFVCCYWIIKKQDVHLWLRYFNQLNLWWTLWLEIHNSQNKQLSSLYDIHWNHLSENDPSNRNIIVYLNGKKITPYKCSWWYKLPTFSAEKIWWYVFATNTFQRHVNNWNIKENELTNITPSIQLFNFKGKVISY